MKRTNILYLLTLIPLLTSCNFSNNKDTNSPVSNDGNKTKEPLVIPSVNVEDLNISLPAKPVYEYKQEDILSDSTYDYLNFYEISDFHGAVATSDDQFGASKLATYLETLRERNKGGTVVLSSGDMWQGSCESNLTRGYLVNYCMNYMGFESMALGNHEFDWTDEWIKKNAELTYEGRKIPFLAGNLIDKTTGNKPDFVHSSTTFMRGNYKIGVIGTIGENLERSILKTNISKYDFTPELSVAKTEAQRLRNDGCDVVIWTSHNGLENLTSLGLTKNDGIDAVFGGHNHQSVFEYSNSSGIPYAASAANGEGIASIKLKINKNTKEVSNSYTTVIGTALVGQVEENNDINTIVNQYSSEIDSVKNIKIGYTSEELTNDQTGDLKNICVDAIQSSCKEALRGTEINPDDAVLAFHHVSGGIRASIDEGDITYGDIYQAFPFDNEIVVYSMTGREIYRNLPKSPYCYYALWHSFKNLEDLDFNKTYYVMTIDYLALTKLNVSEDDLTHTGLLVRDELSKYIYNQEELNLKKYLSYNFRSFTGL